METKSGLTLEALLARRTPEVPEIAQRELAKLIDWNDTHPPGKRFGQRKAIELLASYGVRWSHRRLDKWCVEVLQRKSYATK